MALGQDDKTSPEDLIGEISGFRTLDLRKGCMEHIASIYILMLIRLLEFFHKAARLPFEPKVDTDNFTEGKENVIGVLEIIEESKEAKYILFIKTDPRKKIKEIENIYSVSLAMAILIAAVELLEQNIPKKGKTAFFSPAVAMLLKHKDGNISIQDIVNAMKNDTTEIT